MTRDEFEKLMAPLSQLETSFAMSDEALKATEAESVVIIERVADDLFPLVLRLIVNVGPQKKREKGDITEPHVREALVRIVKVCDNRRLPMTGTLGKLFIFSLMPKGKRRRDDQKLENKRNAALLIEQAYFAKHGCRIGKDRLAHKIDTDEKTIRRWRKEPSYRDVVETGASNESFFRILEFYSIEPPRRRGKKKRGA